MRDAPLDILLRGTAGQSFGAWNVSGLNLTLIGDANDYVGKGMAGGAYRCPPTEDVDYVVRETAIIGNTCLYGATGGQLFAAGRPASASPSAIPARRRLSREPAIIAANT